jgi:ATP-binding cassette, subfamily F, member 3
MQLVVDNIAKSFGIHNIFKNVTFTINKGEKIGLVGVNGSGKTTLLRCLLQPETVDEGSISYESDLRLGYVQQGFANMGEGSLWEFMLYSCPDIVRLREKMARLEAQAAATEQGAKLEEVLADYARTTAQYEQLDGYHYESNIKRVLIGLGFLEEIWNKSAEHFSGGQKTRIMLAAALVNSPDLLILDEPTNHLDIKMTEWLEKYLQEFKGGLLVVSHDRFFLDNVAEKILEMEANKLVHFKGNYTRYLAQKEIQVATREAAYEAQQEYIVRTEDYIRRFKAGIKSKMARGRQSQLNRLERMEAPVQTEEFTLRLPKAPESAEKVIVLEDLKVGYGENILVKNIDLVLTRGEKVAILGANGIGKTTLLKTILQEIAPLGGTAKIGNRVQIGYFSQSYERLNPNETIMDNFLNEYGYTDEQTRKLLGSMLFRGEEVFKEIGTLSGGQKARLVLLKLVLDGANCLLLDEPTNHLDILAKEAVEAALETFDGTVLLVSHDRYLVNEVAERIWEIDEGTIHDYKGSYDFYLEQREKRKLEQVKQPISVINKQENGPKPQVADLPQREKHYSQSEAEKLLPKIELSIREQEAMLKVLEAKIADPSNQTSFEASMDMAKEYEEYKAVIAKLMVKWEQIMESLE